MTKLFFLLIIILQCFGFLTFLLTYTYSCDNSTLKLVHIIFRHGERSPSKTYTNDPYKDYEWPGGWDQLSNRGKYEEYELGTSFRNRYTNFLPPIYNQNDIYVESSYADRCIMSAQLLLAGLYPPKEIQIWNKDLPWQPIPVHSIPRNIDNKIAIKRICPKYLEALEEATKHNEHMVRTNEENIHLFNYLSTHTGDEIQDIRSLETLYNTLEIEQINNLTLPMWTQSVFPDKMNNLAALSLAIFSDTEFMKKMHGGVLVKEMITQMNSKQKNELKPDRKIFLYSGHDLTVVTILRVLGFLDLIKPEFGACLIVELHEVEGKSVVKFFYKKNPREDVVELLLDLCGSPCELTMLNTFLQNVLPTNWEQECLA